VEEATNDITRYRDPNRQAQEYNRLLGEAKEISQKSLERLRELNRRFGFADSILLELEGLEGGKTRREGTPAAYPPPAGRRVCTGTPPAQEVGR
jgi:hypothetical protein